MQQAARRLTLTGKKPTFLLCDIQERFRSTIYQFPAVVQTAQKLIKGARILDCPLIVTQQYPKALGTIAKELDIRHALKLEDKTCFSMLTADVENTLHKSAGPSGSVVLFGIESHVCILQTALELREKNFQVFVVSDGLSSGNKWEIPIAIERMKSSGCIMTTSDSLLFEIMGDAKHAKFKEISALVKENMSSEYHNCLLIPFSTL